MPVPDSQIVIKSCRIGRVVDGDTIDVEITRTVRVRLADSWSPETRETSHASEKVQGLKAKEALEHLAPAGTECALQVMTDGDNDVGDGLTFGRVVGVVWIDGKIPLNEQMVLAGYNFATKAELESHLAKTDEEHARSR